VSDVFRASDLPNSWVIGSPDPPKWVAHEMQNNRIIVYEDGCFLHTPTGSFYRGNGYVLHLKPDGNWDVSAPYIDREDFLRLCGGEVCQAYSYQPQPTIQDEPGLDLLDRKFLTDMHLRMSRFSVEKDGTTGWAMGGKPRHPELEYSRKIVRHLVRYLRSSDLGLSESEVLEMITDQAKGASEKFNTHGTTETPDEHLVAIGCDSMCAHFLRRGEQDV